jgi:phosphatidylserine/phosphatidylglycerophosphate/cardiolipin synthase-like enzyme
MKKLLWSIVLLCIAILGKFSFASNIHDGEFSANTPYAVCFTPGGDCTDLAVNTIDKAKNSILVQAYSFTSAPIAKALVNAKNRGVDVKVILDKSDFSNRYTIATYFKNNGIPVWEDYQPAIAHNKVIIVDDTFLLTGSFNFTKAAQMRNAENELVIESPQLADTYTQNWLNREQASKEV